jgi:hypothetical protein
MKGVCALKWIAFTSISILAASRAIDSFSGKACDMKGTSQNSVSRSRRLLRGPRQPGAFSDHMPLALDQDQSR